MNNTLYVPAPEAPCRQCVEGTTHNEVMGIVWCVHHRVGGIYSPDTGQWTCIGPYACEDEFKRAVLNIVERGRLLMRI